ncbi:MAG: CHRD domain-containing protein [Saprospiraceae bacterium]|nr:CHRD domain-containing protein [Saprospiraceae bacterium]
MKNFFTLLFFLILIANSNGQKSGNWFATGFLNGDQEVPSVATEGEGYVTLLLNKDLTSAQINGVFHRLSGDITGCHLHFGEDDANGPVVINLMNFINGNKLFGTINIPSSFLSQVINGSIYINVHTAKHPAGEIRSQLIVQTEEKLMALLLGSNSVPPVTTTASGLALLTLDFNTQILRYHIQLANLSGPITAAHIHDGDASTNGPAITALSGSGNILSGEFDFSNEPIDFLFKLFFGQLYINVHTSANPAGEIRGQIGYAGPFTCFGILNGSQEVPPVNTGATGQAVVFSNSTLDTLTYLLNYSGLSGAPTAAHVHLGDAGKNGQVLVPLSPSAVPGLYFGGIVIDRPNLALLSTNSFYANIHTDLNKSGEIRGQIETNLRKGFAFDLCGGQSVPSNSSTAYGVCGVSIDQGNTNLLYEVMHTGIGSNVNGGHIHLGAKGSNGNILKELELQLNYSSGFLPINGTEVTEIESGNSYVNIHSDNFPGGEIRGQIDKLASCLSTFITDFNYIGKIQITPNPSSDFIKLDLGAFVNEPLFISISDMNGNTIENISFLGGNTVNVNISNYPSGVYSLSAQLIDSNKRLEIQKFIVVR